MHVYSMLDVAREKWSRLYRYIRGQIVGIDISRGIVENPHIDYAVVGNIELLPFKDETFDLLICEWVLEHLDKPEKAIKEFYRVLKQGGHLFVVTSNILNPIILLAKNYTL